MAWLNAWNNFKILQLHAGFSVRSNKVPGTPQVWFSSKFLQSEAYKRALNAGRPVLTEFGTRAFPDPCKSIFSRMMSTLVSLFKPCRGRRLHQSIILCISAVELQVSIYICFSILILFAIRVVLILSFSLKLHDVKNINIQKILGTSAIRY